MSVCNVPRTLAVTLCSSLISSSTSSVCTSMPMETSVPETLGALGVPAFTQLGAYGQDCAALTSSSSVNWKWAASLVPMRALWRLRKLIQVPCRDSDGEFLAAVFRGVKSCLDWLSSATDGLIHSRGHSLVGYLQVSPTRLWRVSWLQPHLGLLCPGLHEADFVSLCPHHNGQSCSRPPAMTIYPEEIWTTVCSPHLGHEYQKGSSTQAQPKPISLLSLLTGVWVTLKEFCHLRVPPNDRWRMYGSSIMELPFQLAC